MKYLAAANTTLDVGIKAVNFIKGLWSLRKSKGGASSGSGSGALRIVVEDKHGEMDGGNSEPDIWYDASEDPEWAEQDGAGVSHPHSDADTAPLWVSKSLDVPTCVLALFPKGANAAVCAGVNALPVDIIQGFDALVGALKDRASIQDAPEIKNRLGPVRDACDRVLEDIKEADESHDKRFPVRTLRDVSTAERSATELYEWAKEVVSDKLNSSGAMTKWAKLQVVPYIMALTYASRIRVITRLVERDLASEERDKERYLGRACKIVDDFISVVQLALEGLTANTTLAEVALDYEMPIALYLAVMSRFRASVDAIKSPSAVPKDMAASDDGLSSIRVVPHWEPGDGGDQTGGRSIELKNLDESLWWARFADTDFKAMHYNDLKTSFETRELTHALGAGSDDMAHTLALKPGQESALLQLSPASALRSTLCANIAHACHGQAAPPQSFARTSKPPRPRPPPAVMLAKKRSRYLTWLTWLTLLTSLIWLTWITWIIWPSRPPKKEELLSAAAPRTLTGHTNLVSSLVVCPDGDRVLSASADHTVKMWSLSSGQHLRTLSHHTDMVSCVAVSPDGKTAVSGSWDKSVRVWSLESGSVQHTLQGHSNYVWAVAVSPDGRIIASSSVDKTVKLWNAESGQCLATLTGHSHEVVCVAFSPDGETLVSGSQDKSIKVWNVRRRVLERTLNEHSAAVISVAVTPDGSRAVSGSFDGTVRVWRLSSGAEEMAFTEHTGFVTSVAMFPDGQRVASSSADGSVRVWNLRSKALELMVTNSTWIWSVAVSPDGRSVASGTMGGPIKVWTLSGGGGG